MKKIKLVWMLLNLCFASAASAKCPDFSGTYVGNHAFDGWISQETLALKQIGCERIDVVSIMTFKSDKYPEKWFNFTWTINQNPGSNAHWYWNNQQQLESLQKKANTEGCDIRDIIYLDSDKNLNTRWRFECPRGNSGWYTTNIVGGTHYRQAARIKENE